MTEQVTDIGGVRICYETMGDPSGRPLLMIMGLSGPMIWWDDELCQLLVDRGFHVIRFDNRDCGRSQKMSGRVNLGAAFLRLGPPPPYTLEDMADDAAGLLRHLGVPAAHVLGASMGGMIGQTLAVRHPERVLSLVSMMSTTGSRLVGRPHPDVMRQMLAARPRDREEYLEYGVRMFRRIGSPGFPSDERRLRERAAATWDRGLNPAGTLRQLVAIMHSRDRSRQLRRLRIPALVVHGTADKLVHVSGGKATARAIPGAELMLVPGMGHDLPRQLWPRIVDGVVRTADRAVNARSA
jgi:pimeloyl-ACP methyl ester carboxylesterase